MRRTVGVLITTAVVGLAGPGAAQAKAMKGVVVDRAAAEKCFVVATKKGKLVTVNAKRVPRVGARVKLNGRNAADGEFAARRVRHRGTARKVEARGTVTVRGAHSYLVTGRSGTIQVARRARLARAASADAGPEVGDIVVVKLAVDGSDLGELRLRTVGHDAEFEVEGAIEAVDLEQRTLAIAPDEWEYESEHEEWSYEREDSEDAEDSEHDSEDAEDSEHDSEDSEASDDADEATEASTAMFDGSSVLVNVPEGFDLSLCQVGDEVEVEVEYDDETGYAVMEIEGCGGDDDDSDEESDEDSDASDEE